MPPKKERFPRLLCQGYYSGYSGELRLIQLSANEFVVERAAEQVDSLGDKVTTWSSVRKYGPALASSEGGHYVDRWLAAMLAERCG